MKMNKKGQVSFGALPQIAITFLVIGLVFAIALVILASLASNSTITGNAAASGAVNKTILAVAEIPNNWLLLIAVVIAAMLLVGIVLGALAFKNSGSGRM